jgi:hypothetical protein
MPSRPRHTVTEKTRAEVSALASFGTVHDDIATYLGISQDTLIRKYKRELSDARIKANAKVAQSLYRMATEQNNVVAMIFWLKTRARWRETNHLDISSTDGSMSPPTLIEVVAGEPSKD